MKRSTQYGAWAMAFGLAAAKPAWAMSLTQARSYLVDTNATVETTALFWNLKDGMGQRLLFGHQYTTQYGIADGEWTDLPGTQNRSDVKTAVGRFPAVFGTDVSRGLYGSWSYLGNHVRNAYNRKMLVTLSWMMRNPVTGGGHHVSDAERNEPSLTGYPMRELVPGGTGNATYRGWLDQLADFFHNQVKVNDADVPIVFRPFHEHTGGWFWWGEPYCTPEEFKAAWRYTVTYLRDTKSVHNLLFAYSPNGPLTESKILGRYPGDGYVDVIGFDQYSTDLSASARTAVLFAEPRNKVAAITEFGGTAGGLNKLSNGNYYMDFLNAIKSDPYARKVAYALTWGSGSTAAYWVPVQGDAYYNAFVDFYRDPYTAFEGEIGNYYAYPFGVDTQRPAPPSGLTATPVSSSKIALSWADNSTNEDGFKIDRRQSGQTNWLRVATPAANARTYADTGLSPATHYYYKIKATNAAGDSPESGLAPATTPADPVIEKVPAGASWRYRKGTAEPSEPASAWRGVGFDDSGWPSGPAPFGYSSDPAEGPFGTTLSDMRNSYTCLFLRNVFAVDNPARVSELQVAGVCDDGFILWINGEEAARVNVGGAPGTPAPYDALAASSTEPTAWSATLTGSALPALRATNIVAVQVFNGSLGSSDLLFHAHLSIVNSQLSIREDADQDAMPDAWEATHLSDLSDGSELSDADPDGDGLSNLAEYIAGTDPRRNGSLFAVGVGLVGGELQLSFPTVAAGGPGYEGLTRHYALESCTGGEGGDWRANSGYEDVTGAGQMVMYAPPDAHAGTTLYRARVWLATE